MKNATTLIILGIIIAILPFSGLPGSWRDILYVFLGLSVSCIVFYHARTHNKKPVEREIDNTANDTQE